MKKDHKIKAIVCITAILFFLTAWLSYRNFGKVTYTYRMENSETKSDYRFFQYVPGGRVLVEATGEGKENGTPPTVMVEKVKHGTAVMIEGYGLGGESPVQTIRLTYHIDLLSLNAQMPSLEAYWDWVQEYGILARMALNSDRIACGNRAVISMEEADTEYQFNYKSLIRVPIGILAGIIILVSGFKRLTVKWTKSGREAARFQEETEAECDEGGWGNHLRAGKEYFERYIWELDRHYLIFMVLLLTASVILLPFVLETGAAFFAVVVCCIGLILWYSVAAIKSFYRLGGILTEECRPQAAVDALIRVYGTRQLVGMRMKSNYSYQSMISLGFFYGGAFGQALRHLEMVWEELPGYLRIPSYYLHYHLTRMRCFQMLENEGETERERLAIEAFLQKRPRLEASDYAKNYRRQELAYSLMEAGDYREAKRLLTEEAAGNPPRYIQVRIHYDLWRIAHLTDDEEQMGVQEAYIEKYGRETFFYRLAAV